MGPSARSKWKSTCQERSYGRGPDTTLVRDWSPDPPVREFPRRSRMKARLTLLAVPLMIGVAFAQSTPGSAAEQSNPSTANQPSAKASNPPASASTQPAEMKTMTYKGTLVDLGCGAASQNTASTATPSENANSNANSNT